MKKVADKYSAVLTELMKNVESAHKHGLKPQNDVLKVQVKLNESELNIRKADNALRLAIMNLCHYIGKPLTADIRTADTFPEVAQDIRLQTADISARPEYAILNQQVAIAKQQVKLNRSELLPKIGVKGSYDYIHGLEISDQDLFDGGSFSVLLNVSVPLFHFGANSNKVRAAKAKLEQARLEQENMRVSRSQYDVGLETLSDHLEAQALWQQAYETKVDACFRLYLNYITYLKATGTLLK